MGQIKSRVVTQGNLTPECWSIQVWGKSACRGCEYKDTKSCGGKNIRKTGKNAKGLRVPIK